MEFLLSGKVGGVVPRQTHTQVYLDFKKVNGLAKNEELGTCPVVQVNLKEASCSRGLWCVSNSVGGAGITGDA